jgi:FkbM family methyltransferase
MEDYSQTREQAAILKILGHDCTDGVPLNDAWHTRYLDIGAWHATQFSNTRALFELGWSGILIEPSPGPLQGLVREYGNSDRVKVISAAVTVGGGLVELQITDDAVSMPSDSSHMEQWKDVGGFYGKLTVPSISVADLFQQFGGDFEFINIDTEGTSGAIFKEMLRIGPRPRCVVVEHDNNIVELAQYAQEAHYEQVLLNGNNMVLRWKGGRER